MLAKMQTKNYDISLFKSNCFQFRNLEQAQWNRYDISFDIDEF